MDLFEKTEGTDQLEQVETVIQSFIEGNTKPYLTTIDDMSAKVFYTKLKEDLVSSTFEKHEPKVESLSIGEQQFKKLLSEMHIGEAPYHQGIEVLMIDTTKAATIGVAAFDLAEGNRVSLLIELLSNQKIEDFRNLTPNPHAHQTIGS